MHLRACKEFYNKAFIQVFKIEFAYLKTENIFAIKTFHLALNLLVKKLQLFESQYNFHKLNMQVSVDVNVGTS